MAERLVSPATERPGFERILAIIVLYRMSARQSAAYGSLQNALAVCEGAGARVSLAIFDNSPSFQEAPPGFAGQYTRNPANPGLAQPYNLALQAARETGIPWLLLLDQDTTVTRAYIEELLALTSGGSLPGSVNALVPKLIENGIVQSPRLPPAFGVYPVLSTRIHGLARRKLHIYNSGAVLRVSALSAMGGFPVRFPLDYLDHATFHALQADANSIFILQAELQHQLSGSRADKNTDPTYLKRQERIWEAEYAFYLSSGTLEERLLCRLRFLKRALKAIKYGAWSRSRLLFSYVLRT